MSVVLPESFYNRPTLEVLDDIIGKVLVHDVRGVRTAGVIVEAEAYVGESDPACHAAPGPTPRNQPLYGPPGRAYVYFNYGMHHLVNAVTEAQGAPAAILIRALEPLEGLSAMRRRRLRRRANGDRREAERLPTLMCAAGPATSPWRSGSIFVRTPPTSRSGHWRSRTTASGPTGWRVRRGSEFGSGGSVIGGVAGWGKTCLDEACRSCRA